MHIHKTLPATVLAAVCAYALPAQAIELTTLPGLVTSASSCYLGCGNALYDHSNILDGDYGGTGNTGLNAWNSGGYGGWVQVNFGTAYVLDRIELYGAYPYDNLYALSVSQDGTTWQTIATGGYHLEPALTLATTVGGQKYGAVHDTANGTLGVVSGQYLRYTRTGGGQWGYLFELDVQGHVASVPEPESWAMLLAGLGLVGFAARRRMAS